MIQGHMGALKQEREAVGRSNFKDPVMGNKILFAGTIKYFLLRDLGK